MTKIMIADDNSQNVYMLETLLKKNGFETVSAKNGSEALDRANEDPPDLIISDILMPVMDGFKLCHKWKLHDKLKNIPFIFYTAEYTDSRDEQLANALGAERYIIKPQKPEVLIKIIKEVLSVTRQNEPEQSKRPHLESDIEILQVYNAVLFHKLECKVKQLEIDISERSLAEQALRESEERFRKVFENGTIGIAIFDKDALYLRINEEYCRMLGYSEKDLLGKSFIEITHPDHIDENVKSMKLLQSGNIQVYSTEKRYIRKDGAVIWSAIKISTLSDQNDEILYFIVFAIDITQRKKMEEERERALRQIERNLEQLATLNDQIRNPLAIIVARLSLEDRSKGTEQMIEAVRAIDDIVKQLDQGWAESAKVRDFLERNNLMSRR